MATGTTKAVADLLANDPTITAADAVIALQDHNPATVRTQLARQRKHATNHDDIEMVALLGCEVAIPANCDFDVKAFPTQRYAYIVLKANDGRDARVITSNPLKDRVDGARGKARSLHSSDGTNAQDRAWIAEHGGCVALVFVFAD